MGRTQNDRFIHFIAHLGNETTEMWTPSKSDLHVIVVKVIKFVELNGEGNGICYEEGAT